VTVEVTVQLHEISEIVCLQLGVQQANGGDHLQEDLDADSADVLNIVVAVEDRYGVAISEEHVSGLRTVEDLYRIVVRLTAEQ